MKILVRNLNRKTTADTLRQLFSQFGEVNDAVIVYDELTQQSKGFGLIEMPNPKHAALALKRMNLQRVDGEVIRVKSSEPSIPSHD